MPLSSCKLLHNGLIMGHLESIDIVFFCVCADEVSFEPTINWMHQVTKDDENSTNNSFKSSFDLLTVYVVIFN